MVQLGRLGAALFGVGLAAQHSSALRVGSALLHNPPGSNNRNRERNSAATNTDRLFEAAGDAAGGYPWRGDALSTTGDPMVYYGGSTLEVQWSVDGCEDAICDTILQMSCDRQMPGLRDGYPNGVEVASDNNNPGYRLRQFSGEGGQNTDGTNTIPEPNIDEGEAEMEAFYTRGEKGGQEFGLHESYKDYLECRNTERNQGLFNGDANIRFADARGSRNNPNGARRGLECPEERSYYPYWRPTPWQDIAVFPSKQEHCEYYQNASQNTAPRHKCVFAANETPKLIPISEGGCGSAGGKWTEIPSFGLAPPFCEGRGSPAQSEIQSYSWEVPRVKTDTTCIIRLRVNRTLTVYARQQQFAEKGGTLGPGLDAGSQNCSAQAPVGSVCEESDPYVEVLPGAPKMSLPVFASRIPLVHQDRTHVFKLAPRPSTIPDEAPLYNLNTRGRRGYATQVHPALPYDFVPKVLAVEKGGYVHVQFHGSDFNPARSEGFSSRGWLYSDRFNMVQVDSKTSVLPSQNQTLFGDKEASLMFLMVGQDLGKCSSFGGDEPDEGNAIANCGKLNAAPAHFNPDPVSFAHLEPGEYAFMSTRDAIRASLQILAPTSSPTASPSESALADTESPTRDSSSARRQSALAVLGAMLAATAAAFSLSNH